MENKNQKTENPANKQTEDKQQNKDTNLTEEQRRKQRENEQARREGGKGNQEWDKPEEENRPDPTSEMEENAEDSEKSRSK